MFFSCKWGPLGLFLAKRGSYFGNEYVSVGTCDKCPVLFGWWPPSRHDRDTLEQAPSNTESGGYNSSPLLWLE